MKILVTGYLGFIGSALTPKLSELGYSVIGIDLKEDNNILTCDLPACDLVIHLAGLSGVRESSNNAANIWLNNVEGTKRLLNHYSNIRVLVASSSSQYEPHLNPYAASKHVIEKIPHPNVCFMRFHTVYSSTPRSGMFFDKLINNSIEYVTNHERDFIHIDDVCDAVILLISASITGPVDIGTGTTVRISEILPSLPIRNNLPYERTKTLADTSILNSLGFYPKHHVKDFIGQLLSR